MSGKFAFPALLSLLLITAIAEAQGVKRTLNFSIGYGFPDVDKKYLPDYYGYSRGSTSQSGVFTGAFDYRFSRRMSVGVLVAHGVVSAPYYNYYSPSSVPDLTARLETWSFMIQLVRYIPISLRVVPYIKTGLGFNSWNQKYTDAYGNENAATPADVPDFARQIALGVKFRLSERAGFFVEGGYGKYIVLGGLSVKLL
ncbi:MAG TPA: outer membrane beta-barrel protein [Puia sp.]|nr:outer membrane beta-barrel protein [Puia sp.]